MSASIMINNEAKQLFIVVYGDPNSTIVQGIAHKGIELFQKRYPEGNITPYKRKTLFGK